MRVLCSVQLNFVRLDAFTQRLHGHTLIRRRVTRLRPKTLLVAATLYCSRDWGDPSIHCALMIISPSLYRGPPRGPPSEGSLPTELTQLSEESSRGFQPITDYRCGLPCPHAFSSGPRSASTRSFVVHAQCALHMRCMQGPPGKKNKKKRKKKKKKRKKKKKKVRAPGTGWRGLRG